MTHPGTKLSIEERLRLAEQSRDEFKRYADSLLLENAELRRDQRAADARIKGLCLNYDRMRDERDRLRDDLDALRVR